MYGKPGSCKTFIALDMTLHLVNEMKWHSHSINKNGIVLYFLAEGIHGLKHRVNAWHSYHEKEFNPYFFVIPFTGYTLYDDHNINEILKLSNELKHKHNKNICLIVIDTLARAASGLDENSARDMGHFIQRMDYLKNQLNTSIMLVHHCGKDVVAGMRGSTSLLSAADTSIKIDKFNDKIRFYVEKQKDGENIIHEFHIEQFEKSLVPIHLINCIDED